MAARFRTKDRVLETSVTTGVGTYTLAGAVTGFQTFAGGLVASGDLVPYYAEDGINWEAGIGEVLTGPNRLVRTHVLSSSNAGAAVNWGAGTRNLRCGWPAELNTPRIKSVSIAGGAGTQVLTQNEQRCDILVLTGAITGNRVIEVDTAPWRWVVFNNTSGAFTVTLKVTGQTGVAVAQGKTKVLYCDGTDVEDGNTDFPAASTGHVCEGRITLATGVAVTSADQAGKTTIYFTPYKGNKIGLYDGSAWVLSAFAEVSQLTTDNTKSPAAVANNSAYDIFGWLDGSTFRATRGPAWTSLSARGAGAGTTELELFEGRLVNKVDIVNGPAARRGLYLGTVSSDGSAQVNDTVTKRNVFNYYNDEARPLKINEAANSWTYTTATWRPLNNSTANSFEITRGIDDKPFYARAQASVFNGTTTAVATGIGIGSTSVNSAAIFGAVVGSAGNGMQVAAEYNAWPGIGRVTITQLEISEAISTSTWYGDNGGTICATGMVGTLRG